MLNSVQLSSAIDAYRDSKLTLDEFEDWFRDNSCGSYRTEMSGPCASVEAALSKYHFQGIGESELTEELASAISGIIA